MKRAENDPRRMKKAAIRRSMDTLNCVNSIRSDTFSLDDMYAYELMLSQKHPNNRHVKDKIRQQLQMLRDKGYIEFVSRGLYRKIV